MVRCNTEEYREYLIDQAETSEEEQEYENMTDGEIMDIFWSGYEDHCYEVERDRRLCEDDDY